MLLDEQVRQLASQKAQILGERDVWLFKHYITQLLPYNL